ncbi:amino acid adenylation domain-containing protein, partial [Azomonas macrocytogenes]
QAQLDQLTANIPSAQISDIYPLSPMQQGMLFHTLYQQEAGDYINQMRVDVQGLDVERFKAAWQASVDRHDVLRASFVTEFDQPLQVIRKHVELPVTELDCRGQPDLSTSLDTWAEADRQRSFELAREPLLRLAMIRTGEQRHHLILTCHHILLDGWSNSQLQGEVLQRYAGQPPANATGQYRDYIAWLQRQDKVASEQFWKAQLASLAEPTRLSSALRGETCIESGYGKYHQEFDAEQTRRLSYFAREQRVTVNTLIQAAWLLLLQRYTGQETVAFGATVAGRPADLPGVEQQLGLFINTLPVVASPRVEQTVGEWLGQIQSQNLALREHEHTPLYEIQRWVGLGGEALFDSLLVFENYPVAEALQQSAPEGLRFRDIDTLEQTNYPLTLTVGLSDTLSLGYSHPHSVFTKVQLEQLVGHFEQLLFDLIQDPRRSIGELNLLTDTEYQQILHEWNHTQASYPSEQCIHQLIEAQAARTPDATAVVFGEQHLSYDQLNRQANRLAHKLREQGVSPDILVGIAVERSLEMIVGLLAILKAGGAYVPLDPAYPQDRLAYMIEDSGIGLLLTQSPLLERLSIPGLVHSLCLDRMDEEWSVYPDSNLENLAQPENLAYVIYTSGSTGQPKGAGNRHIALTNRLCWMQQSYCLDSCDSVLQKTPFSFDVSVWEFFWPLLAGARLVIAAPGDHHDPARLVALIRYQRITTLHFVPSMLQVFLLDETVANCTSLRRIICSGEALPIDVQRQVFGKLPDVDLLNLYGPTEAAIDVTHWICRDEGRDVIPIGQPIANLATYVLNVILVPVVPGVCGELYLSGAGLARGYHSRPALTAERFVPDPFGKPGGRLYRTGDLARYRTDGVIEYVGRIDHQVKIRGFRIELGEIEARLQEQAVVREAVVIDLDGPSG